jgi:uncharacterized protein (DUF302 family)
MKNTLIALTLAFSAITGTAMGDTMISKSSPHTVAETMDRLSAAVEGAGAKVFARVDHAAGAATVDMELRPTQMLMFGNPKLGTPAMLSAQTLGIELPLRVLAFQDESGQVIVTYNNPMDTAAAHNADAELEVFKMMTGALDKLTDKAISE